MLDTTQVEPERIRPLRRAEYEKMVDLGCFEDERLELLRGMLVTMSPQGSRHADVVSRINMWLAPALLGSALVRVQCPLAMGDDSEPEPDVAVVDRDVKARVYAAGGIAEYWLFNVLDRTVELYRDPAGGVYKQMARCSAGDTLRLDRFPDVTAKVADLIA